MKFTKAMQKAGWRKTSQGFEKTNEHDIHCVIKDNCDYNDDGSVAVDDYDFYISKRIGHLELIDCGKNIPALMKVADGYRVKS